MHSPSLMKTLLLVVLRLLAPAENFGTGKKMDWNSLINEKIES